MAELPALADLTWLDWGVLLLVLIAALGGIARGFLRGTLDLAVGVAALLAAVLTYRQVGALVARLVELPAGLSILAGFLVAARGRAAADARGGAAGEPAAPA